MREVCPDSVAIPCTQIRAALRDRSPRRVMMAVVALTSVSMVSCTSDHQIMNGSGEGGGKISDIGWFMIILSTIIAIGFLSGLAWALFRGGRRTAWKRESTVVIVGGIFLPIAIIGVLTWMTLTTLDGRDGPGTMRVEVIGHQYWWEVKYPDTDVTTANEIVIPVDQPVDIVLTSVDVIHSFWVPDLDGKIDLVPGHTNHLFLTAKRPGRYRGQCAEYCGIQHANMAFVVDAMTAGDFEHWIGEQAADAAKPTTSLERSGLRSFKQLPCSKCHTIRGTGTTGTKGPDLTHLAARETIGAGVSPNDTGHLGGWIANSQTIKPGNLMPAVPMTPRDLQGLVAYLENLK